MQPRTCLLLAGLLLAAAPLRVDEHDNLKVGV